MPRLIIAFSRLPWRTTREDPRLDRGRLDALHTDYGFQARLAGVPDARLGFAYSAAYHDDGFREAAQTLLQLGVRARLHVVMTRGRLYSLLVEGDRPVPHVLGQFLPDLGVVSGRTRRRILPRQGDEARRLKRLSLPALPGIAGSRDALLPVPSLTPVDGEKLVLGGALSPLTRQVLAPVLRIDVDRGLAARLERERLETATGGRRKTVLRGASIHVGTPDL